MDKHRIETLDEYKIYGNNKNCKRWRELGTFVYDICGGAKKKGKGDWLSRTALNLIIKTI